MDGLQTSDTSASCAAGFLQCPQANLLANFCYPSSTTCTILAGATTLLCCPEGSECSTIMPISCDLTQQNPGLHPDSTVKTTALTADLPQCGNQLCCPFGYECVGGDLCQLAGDQSTAPTQSSIPTHTVEEPGTGTGAIPTPSRSNPPAPKETFSDDSPTSPGDVLRIVVPVVVCVVE